MNILLKIIALNLRGIALIVFCGIVGYFFGAFCLGAMVGVAIISLATIFG